MKIKISDASKLLTKAIRGVESRSIQGWARRNRKVLTRMVASGGCAVLGVRVTSHESEQDRAAALTTFLVATAIGL